MLQVILLQLYWLSFLLIGLAGLLAFIKLYPKQSQALTAICKASPVATVALTAVVGIASFVPLIAIAYVFEISVKLVEVCYLVILVTSAVYLCRFGPLFKRMLKGWRPRTVTGWCVLLFVIGSLLLDYILCLRATAPLSADAPVHIARINLIANGSYAFADPYFGNHGVVDPRYSANLMLGLQALGAKLIHMTALQVWLYSLGFFRLLIWLALYFLSFNLLPRDKRQEYSYALLSCWLGRQYLYLP
jgi:hypothetical protein